MPVQSRLDRAPAPGHAHYRNPAVRSLSHPGGPQGTAPGRSRVTPTFRPAHRRFGVSLAALVAANPQIVNPNLIFPGQVVCVPSSMPPIPTVECSFLLFRTANVPVPPDAIETGGVVRVFQAAALGGDVLVAAIGLPPPAVLGGQTYVSWIRGTPVGTVKVQLLQTGPVVTEPGVWVGAFIFGPGEQFAPFSDVIVTAEPSASVTQPDLSRIALIGLFSQCR